MNCMSTDKLLGDFDFTQDGECSRCGACCSNILPLYKEDIKRIEQYMKKRDIKENVLPGTAVYNNVAIGVCPFYNADEKKCDIYNIRPWICREFKCSMTVDEFIRKNHLIYKRRLEKNEMAQATNMRETFFRRTR